MRKFGWALGFVLVGLLLNPAGAGEITAEGKKLAAFLDGMDVENLWLAKEVVNWKTGEKIKAATDGKPHSHCSAFVAAVALRKEVYILRPPEHSTVLLANAQFDWLRDEGKKKGWKRVEGAAEAQHLANWGHLVVATFKENGEKKPGHIAVVRPSPKSKKKIEEEGPQIIQAGMTNSNSTSLKEGLKHHPAAWKDRTVRFYVHDLTWE